MSSPIENLFLQTLSFKSRQFLVERSTAVLLPLGMELYTAELAPRYAYFLTSGIASIVLSTSEGRIAVVGLIGREGVVGSAQLLGKSPDPTRCFMQMPGSALRMPFRELRQTFRCSENIRERLLEFVLEQAQSLSQIAGCHRLHSVEARLAHWLLMVQDRTELKVLAFTQEGLGTMLGCDHPSVNSSIEALERLGAITCKRGTVTILNSRQLEGAACSCYLVTQRLYYSLYKGDPPPLPEAMYRGDQARREPALVVPSNNA